MLSDTTSVENRVTRAHFTARGTALKNASYFPDDPAVSAISLTLDSFSTSHRSRLLYTRGSQNSELSAEHRLEFQFGRLNLILRVLANRFQ